MKTITILRGLPASGKSTYAKENTAPDTVRINRDDIRNMLGYSFDNFDKNLEEVITTTLHYMCEDLLNRGYNLIIDNLNLKQSYVNDINEIAERIGDVEVREVVFPFDLERCILFNRHRGDTVPENVIHDLHKRFKNIKQAEPKYYPKVSKTVVEQNETLPRAVICDLDGTLALFDKKGIESRAYDRDFENDEVNHVVNNILWFHKNTVENSNIIFVSGRSDKFRDVTLGWLDRNILDINDVGIHLIMRKEGDFRKDAVIKQEIYDKYIKDKYNVDFVLDDRNQVVNMWRKNGLTCLQVAEGNF